MYLLSGEEAPLADAMKRAHAGSTSKIQLDWYLFPNSSLLTAQLLLRIVQDATPQQSALRLLQFLCTCFCFHRENGRCFSILTVCNLQQYLQRDPCQCSEGVQGTQTGRKQFHTEDQAQCVVSGNDQFLTCTCYLMPCCCISARSVAQLCTALAVPSSVFVSFGKRKTGKTFEYIDCLV